MSDLISRQQALKEMWKALYEYEDKTEKQFQKSKNLDVRDWIMNDRLWVQNGHNLCVNVLANLPSAQPPASECWRCNCKKMDTVHGLDGTVYTQDKDKQGWTGHLPSAQSETHDKRTETHACDLISRQAAIDAVAKWFYDVFGVKESDGTATIFKRLRELPFAQQQRKTGKWVSNGVEAFGVVEYWVCNQCYDQSKYRTNFCPSCGADMRGDTDE